ncbi:Two pore potassium channel [Seminavis robusta]|uniref:Two pore potassium channel n=1 Tax=Seminavis robusta TaxID=568900 RepID=A0A9N8HY64_9STRA|nr:Two pore potassium channel [Seminavis robusta]|eukprot:Sro1942_g306720.1 Two pore potassium channel (525) ;mRNA; r:1018-2928
MNKSVRISVPPKKDENRGPSGMEDEETGFSKDLTTTSNSSDDEDMLSRRYSVNKSTNSHLHMLTTYRVGESKVEKMATKIQKRLDERVPVTFKARKTFLKHCRKIACDNGYSKLSRVKYSDILRYHDEVQEDATDCDTEGYISRASHFCGVLSHTQCLAEILEKAKIVGENVGLEPDDDFHYQDFNFFHTTLVSRWPFMRHDLLKAFGIILIFYFLTPILFCVIMKDEGVCPSDSKVPGWVNALYFASTTMSTVGYGDLSVEKQDAWRVAIGMFYMIAAIIVAITAFAAAADSALSPMKNLYKYIAHMTPLTYPEGPLQEGELLYQRVRKVTIISLFDVAFQFTVLNLIGIFASQLFVEYAEVDPERQWDWVDSMYWAVQTSTTVGYGDLSMPEYMRPFQIIYLSLSTYLTGSALGRLASLKEEIEAIRRHHAFERREVNKHMMHYLASTDDPTRVDQYEFVIASLLNLGKIDAGDIEPIMDKFRSLARHSGHSGFIRVEDIPDETDSPLDDDELEEVEGVEGA